MNNTTGQNTTDKYWLVESTLLISIGGLGSLGNLLVIITICKTKKLRNVTHYLIANLAAADMLVASACIDKSIWKTWNNLHYNEISTFSQFFCKLSAASMFVAFMASANILIALSIERYYSVLKPFEHRLDRRRLKILIVCIWTLSTIFGIPQIYTTTDESRSHYQCFVPQIDSVFNLYYFMILALLLYVIPLVTLCNFYIRIGIFVLKTKVPGDPTKGAELLHQKRNHRVVTTCFVVTALYMLSALPMAVNFIIIAFGNGVSDGNTLAKSPALALYSNISQAIYILSCIYNPVIYNCLSSDFRQALLKLFCRYMKRHKFDSLQYRTAKPTVNIRI